MEISILGYYNNSIETLSIIKRRKEHEAKRIYKNGKLEAYFELVKDNLLSIEEAAKRVEMTVEDLKKALNKV